MTLGRAPTQSQLIDTADDFCKENLGESSIYSFLHRECHRMFADEMFADLYKGHGRKSVPPRILAVIMILQRLEGLSDREAIDRFKFDLRWKYAAGGLKVDYPGFDHTVLVNLRARLRRSEKPDRIFECGLAIAKEAGLLGKRRVLDSTALYDAVATQDTVVLVRHAIRGVLRAVDPKTSEEVRGKLKRQDDYDKPGKPPCDWDNQEEAQLLIDALTKDANEVLQALAGKTLTETVKQAARLLATVVAQDIELGQDGVFKIVRRVAPDRVISTVDPQARHGHKTESRSFDGYKGHIVIDPDSEIITGTVVTPGNAPDNRVAKELLKEITACVEDASNESMEGQRAEVYGDGSYGTSEIVEHLESYGIEPNVKVQLAPSHGGQISKDSFKIDLEKGTVSCPAGRVVLIKFKESGKGQARFGSRCADCPMRSKCTDSKYGRGVAIHPREETIFRQRTRQREPEWKAKYRAIRPKVERKIAHMMRRRHGGRRARVRGQQRVGQDFALLAAATNLARFARLGVRREGDQWAV